MEVDKVIGEKNYLRKSFPNKKKIDNENFTIFFRKRFLTMSSMIWKSIVSCWWFSTKF